MDERDYRRARTAYLRDATITVELDAELRATTRRMLRRRVLPPSFSPYGSWDGEAAEEIAQAWITQRLLAAGQLRPLLARAGDLAILRARAERSLRQFVLNERDRSHRQNLYSRLRRMLEDDEDFRCFLAARHPQDRWFGLHDWDARPPFERDDRRLHAAAWSAGALSILRYRADARKLSPLLDASELNRFAIAVFEALQALLTPPLLLDALAARVPLGDGSLLELDETVVGGREEPHPADELALRELAVAALAALTARQAEVLLGTADGLTLEAMADELACSRATILNEQRRAGELLTRLSGDDAERARLLNSVLDLLYESHEP